MEYHKTAIGENEAVHQAHDMESVEAMLDCIMPILEEQLGAWPEYWEPGGYTNGDIKEAVVDPVPEGSYTFKHLFE